VDARKLAASRTMRRAAMLAGALAVVALAIASFDLQPNLARLKATILSGSRDGHYYATVAELAAAARAERGRIDNVATQGSIENIQHLAAARGNCAAHFALAQDGLDWPSGLELVARLPRSESVFFLGREADRIHALIDLRGFHIGI
jgi:hypothetical protein